MLEDAWSGQVFTGKVVLITGGASGIGAGIAKAFAASGAAVVINDLQQELVDATVTSLRQAGARVLGIVGDVSQKADVARFTEATLAEFGSIDVLVNNAGIKTNRPDLVSTVVEMPDQLWQQTLNVNLTGPMLASRAVAKTMIARDNGGAIVNITSGAAYAARVGAAAYCVSKAGLAMLTKVLAIELAQHGIRVNAVAPGLVITDEGVQTEARLRYLDAMRETIPLGRFGEIDEIARVVLFLASPAASFVTGEQLSVNGGSHAGSRLPRSS